MYAGTLFTGNVLNKGDFLYREGRPCTAPSFGWFIFGLVIKLEVIYGPFTAFYHWTRLKVMHLRFWRSYWMGQFSRASYNLTLGYLHVVSSWYSSGKVEEGSSLLAKRRLDEIWKKNILAFQHQSPEWDDSSRPGLKKWLHRSLDFWERAFVLWCCIEIGTRLGKRCLLTKDGHNRQFVTLCQESYCGGVHRPTLAKRPPQRLCCSPPAEPGNRGERSSMTAMRGADNLSGLLTSSLRLFIGTYLAQNSMTGSCEALNIITTYPLPNGFPETLVKVLLFPKLSSSIEHIPNTPAGKPGQPFLLPVVYYIHILVWIQSIFPGIVEICGV